MKIAALCHLRATVILLILAFGHAVYAEDVVDNLDNTMDGMVNLAGASTGFVAEAFTTGPEFVTLDSITVTLENLSMGG